MQGSGVVLLARGAFSRLITGHSEAARFRVGGEQLGRTRVRAAKLRQDGMAERLRCLRF